MTALALPIGHIGPSGAGSLGSVDVEATRPGEFKRLPGQPARESRKPLMPPEIDLSEANLSRLCNYLDGEINACRMERGELVRKWARYKDKYRTKFPEFPKDWPIANASQLVLPVIKTAVHSLGPRLFQTIMAADPLISVRTKDPDFQDFAFTHELFLDTYDKEKIDIEDVLDGVVTECIKLGDAVMEVTNRRDHRSLATLDPLTGVYQLQSTEIFNGPTVYHIPLEDFWIRPGYTDLNTAPWCGKVLRLTWSQIKDMAYSGEFDPTQIDKIWRHVEGLAGEGTPDTVRQAERQEKYEPNDRELYEVFEIAVRWDTNGDGMDEELLVYYHAGSRTLLRRKFSGFKKGRRPWVKMSFIRVEHRFYSEGLCEILEHLQEEISTIHNQRIDNATLANLQIILVTKLIKGLSPGDRLWTGKIVKVSDVDKDVGTLRLGETYPSTAEAEQISQGYIREVSGVGEMANGTAQPTSRATATAQLAMLEEMNRRFDKILKSMRKSIRLVHIHLSDLFQQQGTGGLAEKWFGPIKGRAYEQYLQLPDDVIASRVKIQVMSTKSTVNREIEFQSQIAVMNLIIQMGQQIMALGQQFAPEALPVLAHELVKSLKPVLKKIMQYADAANPDEAISVLSVLERILPSPEDMGGMGAAQSAEDAYMAGGGPRGVEAGGQSSRSQQSARIEGEQRMGDLLSILGQANGRRPSMAKRGKNGR